MIARDASWRERARWFAAMVRWTRREPDDSYLHLFEPPHPVRSGVLVLVGCVLFVIVAVITAVNGDYAMVIVTASLIAPMLVLGVSPLARLSADGFPSVQPRGDGSLTSIAALKPNSLTNLLSLLWRYGRWLSGSCLRQVQDGESPVVGAERELSADERVFMFACKFGNLGIVEAMIAENTELLNAKTARGTTALMLAAYYNRAEVVEVLIRAGADVNARSKDGTTALILACGFRILLPRDTVSVVSLLLQSGALVNAAKYNGVTALMVAVYFDRRGFVEQLLLHDADVTMKTLDGVDAHQIAAQNNKRRAGQLVMRSPLVLTSKNEMSENNDRAIVLPGGARVILRDNVDIGSGAFGNVFKGRLGNQEVAVKRIIVTDVRNYQQEVGALSALGAHHHIVAFFGAARKDDYGYIVMELCAESLRDYLHKPPMRPLDARLVRRWMVQCSEGLQFLHSQRMVHRDIKPANILLKDGDIKIADFGFAKAFRSEQLAASMTHRMYPRGTYPYMAPELFDTKRVDRGTEYSFSSDVYAFGIVLWECGSRQAPYAGLDEITIISAVSRGDRPQGACDPQLPAAYAELFGECWRDARIERPNVEEVARRLREMFDEPPDGAM